MGVVLAGSKEAGGETLERVCGGGCRSEDDANEMRSYRMSGGAVATISDWLTRKLPA